MTGPRTLLQALFEFLDDPWRVIALALLVLIILFVPAP